MLKSKTEADDGRGNFAVRREADIAAAVAALGSARPLYAERWADFALELAVMVVKTADAVLAFPVVETVHEDSICRPVYAPPRRVPQPVAESGRRCWPARPSRPSRARACLASRCFCCATGC